MTIFARIFRANAIRLQGGASSVRPDFERLIGSDAWLRLTPAIRRRFSPCVAAAHYSGQALLAANPAGRLIAWLVIPFGRPLPTGHGLQPAEIDLLPVPHGQRWLRRYLRPRLGWEHVTSTKKVDSRGRLYECAGPLAMRLTVGEDKGALTFTSDGYFLDLFGWRIPLPPCLTPGQIRVVHADTGPGRFRFTLDSEHTLFGHTFHQIADFIDPVATGGAQQ